MGAEAAVAPLAVEDHLAAWREKFRVPAVLTSSDFLVLWRNRSAAGLLAGADPKGQVGKPLAWADRTYTAQLRVLADGLADEPRLWAYDPPGRPRLLVRIELVSGPGGERAFGLLFYGGDAPVTPLWADLSRIFGLTPAEAVVVRGLVSGRGAEQLAGDQGIGVETVRTHIRRAYDKLGVDSREQLYAVVSPLCVL
jgi:DNA-binding CsgD family transcriptional regulator